MCSETTQEHPHSICQNQNPLWSRAKCRNPRCSLACRAHWASKEASILTRFLLELDQDNVLYFGVLKIVGPTSWSQHRSYRSAFLKLLKPLNVRIYLTAEIGCDRTTHYHYTLVSKTSISKEVVRTAWQDACGAGRQVIVNHEEPCHGMIAAVKYQFADLKNPGFVRLFEKGSPPITWGTRGFFGLSGSKKRLWKSCLEDWYPCSNRNFFTQEIYEHEEQQPSSASQWDCNEHESGHGNRALPRDFESGRLGFPRIERNPGSNRRGDRICDRNLGVNCATSVGGTQERRSRCRLWSDPQDSIRTPCRGLDRLPNGRRLNPLQLILRYVNIARFPMSCPARSPPLSWMTLDS
jgi:hypothetical protein